MCKSAVTFSVQLFQAMECIRGNSWCQYTHGLPFTDIGSGLMIRFFSHPKNNFPGFHEK